MQRLNSNIERKHVNAITEQKQALAESLLQVSGRLKSVNKQNDELLTKVGTQELKITQLIRQSEVIFSCIKYINLRMNLLNMTLNTLTSNQITFI